MSIPNKKIVVTSNSFSSNDFLRKSLLEIYPATTFNQTGKKYSPQELIQLLQNMDGAVVGIEKINFEILQHCKNLKIVSKYGVGVDNIDFDACEKANVKIGWTPGVNALSVAEETLGFMIGLSRNLYKNSNALKKGEWIKNGGKQLSELTIGIIGVGHIGKKLIELLKPFKPKILVNDIIDQAEYYKSQGLTPVSKEELYRQSDIITIHTPLTKDTHYLIDKKTLGLMKKTAFLINAARGHIVKGNDLLWALNNNIIAGAALDVYEEEPISDLEFLSHPNLICTPHIGGNSHEAVLAMGLSAIEHLRRFQWL